MATSRLTPSQIRELVGSLEERVPTIAPLYTEALGTVTQVPGVVNEYAVALTIKDDLTSNAKRWSDHTASYTDSFLGLLLFILAIEDASIGSSFIHCSKDADPAKYERIVRAIAKQYVPKQKCTKEDADLVRKYCIPWLYINPQHQRDIRAMKKQLEDEEKEKTEKANKNKKKDEEKEEEQVDLEQAIEEAEEEEEDQRWQQISKSSMGIPSILSFFESLNWHNRAPQRGARSDIVGPITELNCVVDNNAFFNRLQTGSIEEIHPDLAEIPMAEAGAEAIPKAQFVVSAISNTFGATVGYLVRILQLDPAWNPGKLIHTLIDEDQHRRLHRHYATYRDPRPAYAQYQGTQFPVHSMTWARWTRLVDNYGYTGRATYRDQVKRMAMVNRADTYSSDYHPGRVFTLERALRRLEKVGGDVGNIDEYNDVANKAATWPRHLLDRTRSYMPNQVFWEGFEYVGLSNQFFPFACPSAPAIAELCRENMVVRKSEVIERMPKYGNIKTGNLLVQMEMETDFMMNPVRQLKPPNIMDLYDHGQETQTVHTWREQLLQMRKRNMEQFETLCMLEGNLEQLPISGPMKATLRFLHDFHTHNDHITFELKLWDPQMSFFGNLIVKDTIDIFSLGKIIRPMISFKTQGLFSVAQGAKSKLLFHYLLYGEHSAGKSESGPNFVYKMCIPGTTQKIDRKTDAAEQTDVAIWDLIQVEEEMDEAFVDPKVGARQVAKVNMKKSAMTSGAVSVAVFEKATIPGYGDLRASRVVHTPHKYVTMATTNAPNVADGPIGSRFYNETIKKSNVPINEFDFSVDKACEARFIGRWRVYQALSYWVDKAVACNVIAEPQMIIWKQVSHKMFECLNMWGVIPPDRNPRVLVIMTNFARQMVIKRALSLAYNIRGAPLYQRKFDPAHLSVIQRYMYCTTDIIIFTWTALSNEIIHDEFGRILNAAFQYATGIKHDWDSKTMTPYTIFQQDTKGEIKFKRTLNPNWNAQMGGSKTNKYNINLSYIELPGSLDEVSRSIATRTSLSSNDVMGALIRMSRLNFPPNQNGRNGYKAIPHDDLMAHRAPDCAKLKMFSTNSQTAIETFCEETYKTCVYDVVANMTDTTPENLSTYIDAQKVLATALAFQVDESDPATRTKTYQEIVFLKAVIKKWKCPSTEVRRVMKALAEEPIDLAFAQRVLKSLDGFVLYPNHDMAAEAANHRLDTFRLEIIRMAFRLNWIREYGTEDSFRKPHIFNNTGSFPAILTEDDIPPMSTKTFQEIPVVQIFKDKVCFSPMAIGLFDKSVIMDAFKCAVICGSTKPGKRVLGWPMEDDFSTLQVENWTRSHIDTLIGFYNRMADNRAYNRHNGVAYKQRGYIDKHTNVFLGAAQTYESNLLKIADLDKWSAIAQHIDCGLSFKDPVHDPTWIRENYERCGGELGKADYPKDMTNEKKKQEKSNWAPNEMNVRQ